MPIFHGQGQDEMHDYIAEPVNSSDEIFKARFLTRQGRRLCGLFVYKGLMSNTPLKSVCKRMKFLFYPHKQPIVSLISSFLFDLMSSNY